MTRHGNPRPATPLRTIVRNILEDAAEIIESLGGPDGAEWTTETLPTLDGSTFQMRCTPASFDGPPRTLTIRVTEDRT